MKPLYFIFAIIGLTSQLSLAQSGTTNRATTQPNSRTVVTNRQQELYDQYHGISKKPSSSTPAAATTATTNRAAPEQPTVSTTTQPPAVDAPRKAMTRETMTRPERIALDGTSSSFRLGARGGVTYPFYTEKIAGIEAQAGFTGGVVLNFGKGTISFQPEVNYTRYTQRVTDLFAQTVNVATDFIEVPLFLKISSGTYAGSRFFVNIGPYGSYLSSASIDGKKRDVSNTPGRFGFGGAAGIGAALKAGPGHVTIEVRGLYPLSDTDGNFSTDSKIVWGQGALGYIFPL
ncbi:porin family protein [Spirosoma aerolatum]|uniref:porin family protein n=1 Tax=Spirosoma aerolatum TaxID=1211326 RepID=UPI0009AE3098|nr:porin family protein [Spirosoma aerolatum]